MSQKRKTNTKKLTLVIIFKRLLFYSIVFIFGIVIAIVINSYIQEKNLHLVTQNISKIHKNDFITLKLSSPISSNFDLREINIYPKLKIQSSLINN